MLLPFSMGGPNSHTTSNFEVYNQIKMKYWVLGVNFYGSPGSQKRLVTVIWKWDLENVQCSVLIV